MKSLLFILFIFFFNPFIQAQGDSFGNPMQIDPACYPEMTNDTILPFGSFAISSGNSFYFSFTAEQKAIKIFINSSTPANLNPNIELLTSTNTTITSQDNNTLWYSNLTSGDTYFIKISDIENDFIGVFSIKIEDIEDANLNDSYSPSKPLFDNNDGHYGYRVSNTIERTGGCNYITDATKWYLYDSNQILLAEYTKIGNSYNLQLEQFTDYICFDNSYYIKVEVQIEGNWLGTSNFKMIQMESEPFADYLDTSNLLYAIDTDHIDCENIGSGNSFEWEITSLNNEEVYTIVQSSTHLYLNTIDCFLDNTIYSIRQRSTYCGQVGPWTESITFMTTMMPTISLTSYINPYVDAPIPLNCSSTLPLNSIIITNNFNRAEEHIWQLTPIEENDPTMTPIGLPILVNTGINYALGLVSIAGIEVGTTYRVGVKWGHGGNGCIYQESDYGNFCPITIAPPSFESSQIQNGNNTTNSLANITLEESQSQMNTNITPNQATSLYSIRIYDLTGRLVHFDHSEIYTLDSITTLNQFGYSGNYIVVYTNSQDQKIFHKYFN